MNVSANALIFINVMLIYAMCVFQIRMCLCVLMSAGGVCSFGLSITIFSLATHANFSIGNIYECTYTRRRSFNSSIFCRNSIISHRLFSRRGVKTCWQI